MRKRLGALFLAMALLGAFALPAAADIREVDWEGVSYAVDTEEQAIFDGTHSYTYEVSVHGAGIYDLKITYPNGATWDCEEDLAGGTIGWSDSYDIIGATYPTGDTLQQVLDEARVLSSVADVGWRSEKSVLLFLVLLILGLFSLFYPYGVWYLERGWYYKDAEPSEAAPIFNRVVGILLLAGALIWFIFL